MRKIAILPAALAALATMVLPAEAAKPTAKPNAASIRCVAHRVSYEVSGTLNTVGSLTRNSDGTYSGALTVHVTRADDHARADKGAIKSYTLNHAKVSFGHGVNHAAPAAGSRASLHGTVTVVAKSCTAFTPTTTIQKVELHTAHK